MTQNFTQSQTCSCCGFQRLEYIVNKALCMLTDFTDFADFMETKIVIKH